MRLSGWRGSGASTWAYWTLFNVRRRFMGVPSGRRHQNDLPSLGQSPEHAKMNRRRGTCSCAWLDVSCGVCAGHIAMSANMSEQAATPRIMMARFVTSSGLTRHRSSTFGPSIRGAGWIRLALTAADLTTAERRHIVTENLAAEAGVAGHSHCLRFACEYKDPAAAAPGKLSCREDACLSQLACIIT